MGNLIDRNKIPVEKKQIKFSLPEIKKFTLNNDLKVTFVPKRDLPLIQIILITEAGSKFDPDGKSGLAFLLSLLIDEGAGKYAALELDNEFEKLGTAFNVNIDEDNFFISMLTLKENFTESLELFALVALDPHLNEEDFNREKIKQLTQILQLQDKPSYIANLALERELFRETHYSRPTVGIQNQINSITREDVKDFYEKFFKPQNSNLIVVGNIETDELLKELEKRFSNWTAGNFPELKRQSVKRNGRKVILIDKKGAPQSEIYSGHLSGNRKAKNFFEKEILNSVLGGQFFSRLNLNLREKRGYTYGIRSSFYYNKLYGQFNISTSVETGKTTAAMLEIFHELKEITNGISLEELEFTKSYLIKKLPSHFETYGQIVRNIANIVIFGLPDDYFNNYIPALESISLENINSVAKDVFHADELIWVVVGDAEKLSDKFSKTNEFGEVQRVEIEEIVN